MTSGCGVSQNPSSFPLPFFSLSSVGLSLGRFRCSLTRTETSLCLHLFLQFPSPFAPSPTSPLVLGCDGGTPPLGLGDMPVQEMAVSPVKSLYWEKFPPMSQRRVYCTPVYHEGLLYVLGGCSETGMPLDSVEVLDVETQTWSQLPPLPSARAGASAVALGGQVVVLGGMNQQQIPLASVEMYHPDEGKWETKASLSQPSMGVTALEKGKEVNMNLQQCCGKTVWEHMNS